MQKKYLCLLLCLLLSLLNIMVCLPLALFFFHSFLVPLVSSGCPTFCFLTFLVLLQPLPLFLLLFLGVSIILITACKKSWLQNNFSNKNEIKVKKTKVKRDNIKGESTFDMVLGCRKKKVSEKRKPWKEIQETSFMVFKHEAWKFKKTWNLRNEK